MKHLRRFGSIIVMFWCTACDPGRILVIKASVKHRHGFGKSILTIEAR